MTVGFGRDQIDEVAVTFLVFTQQHQVVVPVALHPRLVALLRDVHFAPDHRVNALGLGGIVELHRAKEISMIRHGHRRHLLLGNGVHQL